MNKNKLIKHLEMIADLLEFNGENPFKVSSFRNGARIIRQLPTDIEIMIKDRSLENIKGIGKGLISVIDEFYQNEKSNILTELLKTIPESLLEIFEIRGLGPKKINILHKELEIKSIGELEYACRENRLTILKGFGIKTQESIINEIEKFKQNKKFILLHHADKLQSAISKFLSSRTEILEYSISGEFRRRMEIISNLDYVLLVNNSTDILSILKSGYLNIINENEQIVIKDFQIPVRFFIVHSHKDFIHQLLLTTGSSEFISILNWSITDSFQDEREIFSSFKIEYVEPERREKEYFQFPKFHDSNSDLLQEKMQGFFHFHTTYSDGSNSLEEMIIGASNRGYNYFAVCDHSKSAVYANGLNEQRIIKQKEEIKLVSQKLGVRIFHGIESDILINGDLDYERDFLQNFDFIVASVHSVFSLGEEEMTNRLIRAVENPFTDVLGHPSGRLLLARDSYKINFKKVIDACASNRVAIEINANPFRLDLDWRNIFYAREKECLISINPDAHSVDDINYDKYGIMVARKAGLQVKEVINCFSLSEFIHYLNRKVTRGLK